MFSKLWYLTQIPLLPHAVAIKATSMTGSFLKAVGLRVTCIFSRGQALLSQQLCHHMTAGGTPDTHLTFWLGQAFGNYVP
jgi:hypothetical protein